MGNDQSDINDTNQLTQSILDNMTNEIIRQRNHKTSKRKKKSVKTIFDAIYYGDLDIIKSEKFNNIDELSKRPHGISPLFYAAKLGELEIVEYFINEADNIDINEETLQNNETPLYIACREGKLSVVQLLLSHSKCDCNKPDWLGLTPLYAACAKGEYDIVVELLKRPDIDVNYTSYGGSCALIVACQNGHTGIVRLLLNMPEIEVNIVSITNTTPLCHAALGGHSEIVKLLLNHKDIKKNEAQGRKLLHTALERGMHEIVQILIDSKEYKIDITACNLRGYTPLHIAAGHNHPELIDIIMRYHYFANMIDELIAFWSYKCGMRYFIPTDIIGLIKTHYGESSLNKCDKNGRTALFHACHFGNLNAFNKLMEYENLIITKDHEDGYSMLHVACQGGCVDIVERLIKLGDVSGINGVDRLGRTPFFIACQYGRTKVVEWLMSPEIVKKYNININQRDSKGITPFCISINKKQMDCVEALALNPSIDIGEPEFNGEDEDFVRAVIDILSRRKDLKGKAT